MTTPARILALLLGIAAATCQAQAPASAPSPVPTPQAQLAQMQQYLAQFEAAYAAHDTETLSTAHKLVMDAMMTEVLEGRQLMTNAALAQADRDAHMAWTHRQAVIRKTLIVRNMEALDAAAHAEYAQLTAEFIGIMQQVAAH